MLTATVLHPGRRATLAGSCSSRTYSNIAANTIQAIIDGLKSGGATVTGNNPWNVDTHNADVKLRGTWNEAARTLQVDVTDSAFYASCDRIWSEVDSKLTKIIAANPPPPPMPTGAALAPALESLAREVVEKSSTGGTADVNVVNIFRFITTEADRNAVALRANVLAAATEPRKIAAIQASLIEARRLSPIVVALPPVPVATSKSLSRGAKIGIGVAIVGATTLSFLIGRTVGTMRP